jgi:hypothetical protein
VGDSRAYLIRGGRIRQLTDDHSIVGELLRRNEISEDAAREHPHRHVLTRALGVRRAVEPDLAELTPFPGDLFVLCSDGLTNHVEDSEIAKLVSRARLNLRTPVDLANGRGGGQHHPGRRPLREGLSAPSGNPDRVSARDALRFARRRSTALVWIWHTRDSVMPRIPPISFMLRSS